MSELKWIDGEVALRLRRPLWSSPLVEVSAERALVRFPTIGRLSIHPEGPVTVDRVPGADEDDVQFLLRGPARALQALLNGRFTLRASAASVDGRAVVAVGHPTSGKSVAVAGMMRRGATCLTDGATVIESDNVPEVFATRDGVALWPRALEALSLDPGDGVPLRRGTGALRFGRPESVPDSPLPVALIAFLTRGPVPGDSSVERVKPDLPWLFAELPSFAWFREAIIPLGLEKAHFSWMAAIAAASPVIIRRTNAPESNSYDAVAEELLCAA